MSVPQVERIAANTLDDYRTVVGDKVIDELYQLSEPLRGRHLQHINSTRVGGGVAEILQRMVPLTSELGLEVGWDVIEGNPDFFHVTKSFHNALQGMEMSLTNSSYQAYLDTNRENATKVALYGDVVFIHDPQPAALIDYMDIAKHRPVWRCHIDIARPNESVWRFLLQYVCRYTAAIFSVPAFARELPLPQFIIAPSIDPLSDKNRPLPDEAVRRVLEKYNIDPTRPVLTQISRYDWFKDPLGVINAYKMVKRSYDCQLVLAGGGATDDPEGAQVLAAVQEASTGDPDIHILLLPAYSDLEINALQRGSTIILQKSTKEGFGLTVTEGLWKGKPVIGGAVGGIPLQIIDGTNGYLVHSSEGAAFRIKYLLSHPEVITQMGKIGQEHVKHNFLLTRHIRDYLMVMLAVINPDQDIVYLR
ncbi:MAG: glycosyltransferase [Acidobacteriota bacterium]